MTTFFLCALCELCARYSEFRLRLRRARTFVVKTLSHSVAAVRRQAKLFANLSQTLCQRQPKVSFRRIYGIFRIVSRPALA